MIHKDYLVLFDVQATSNYRENEYIPITVFHAIAKLFASQYN